MILVISNEADYSTSQVVNWLHFYNADFIRVNQEDLLDIEFPQEDILFRNHDFSFRLSDIKSVWYRRGFLNFTINKIGEKQLDHFRKCEFVKLQQYINYKLGELPNINNFLNIDVNKLIVNEVAKKNGLLVPEEYLLDNKSSLLQLLPKGNFVTKSITGSSMFFYEDFYFVGYTSTFEGTDFPETFFPSLVQKNIDKKYELRIFFMHDVFWSMAIFSQNDEQTKVDFRKYNNERPNRNIPFNLPQEIKTKLIVLMKELKLNCGSIDMIVTNMDEYYFLEVNPIGQFGMVSNPCNFYLHKEIAKKLVNLQAT